MIRSPVVLVVAITWFQVAMSESDVIPSSDDSTHVVGLVGQSIRLPCNMEPAGGSDGSEVVEWIDLVYNTDREPQRIYSSQGGLGLDKTHKNTANYQVDQVDFTLVISNLKVEQDAGQYICRRITKGEIFNRSYYLNVGDVPKCRGYTDLRPGATTRLSCQAMYSGVLQPVLTWVRDGIDVESVDDYDIMLAGRTVRVPAVTEEDDGVEYTCHMKFGLVVEQCRMRLDVAYLARDIVLTPQKSNVKVGEELRCSSRGNPVPEITLSAQRSPAPGVLRQGKGWKSISIPDEWHKQEVTITCTAKNTVDGATEILTQTAIFNVTDKEKKVVSRGAVELNDASVVAIVAGIVITLVISVCALVAVILLRRRNMDKKKPPKGSKPVLTKEEITLDPNGQAV